MVFAVHDGSMVVSWTLFITTQSVLFYNMVFCCLFYCLHYLSSTVFCRMWSIVVKGHLWSVALVYCFHCGALCLPYTDCVTNLWMKWTCSLCKLHLFTRRKLLSRSLTVIMQAWKMRSVQLGKFWLFRFTNTVQDFFQVFPLIIVMSHLAIYSYCILLTV